METTALLIDGEWAAGSGEPFESVNPADGSVNRLIATASPADVDRAVAAAAAAQPAWHALRPDQRAAVLRRIGDLLEAHGEELAQRQMRENGKLLGECRAQAAGATAAFRYFAGICDTMVSEVAPHRGDYLSMVVYEPYGVVAAITPWNSPLTLESQKVSAALAAGNAVVLKTSEVTPTIGLELGRLALEAGLPVGVLNVLTGPGGDTGAALVEHPRVRMISFTGGTATGRAIGRSAAERMVPVALELGGKSPHVVFADADLDRAVTGVANGIFTSSGQSCIAGSRLFVERCQYDEFVGRLVEYTSRLRVGPPDRPESQIAPLSSDLHRHRVEAFVDEAVAQGAKVLSGGTRPHDPELADGAYYLPTVLADLPRNARIVREEVFGPVLCVFPFDDEADLIAQANDTDFGLACGIWTRDYQLAYRVGRAVDAGTVWINTYKQISVAMPFGGFKASGVGREKGLYGIRTYQAAKSIYWGMQ
ncbi:aldehyde dehydrogenase [Streptomyces melanosporofaciens]|uniref:Acyl-CoA reductase n=1 Tax=Streptomyces melanosporofaciens TaxID=67327 RepID=A0A1H5CB42_STRMJ|nr:aldehyde dehydrogenase [Streptomyces melanosporofaciens]SED63698.1 Acyl-CoA reductase [Streptomyces melanosporofaciens]